MPILETSIDARSREYAENRETMVKRVEALRETSRMLCNGGGEEARARHLARGKMPPRERISALIDPLSPFSKSANSRPMACMTGGSPARGWSPA